MVLMVTVVVVPCCATPNIKLCICPDQVMYNDKCSVHHTLLCSGVCLHVMLPICAGHTGACRCVRPSPSGITLHFCKPVQSAWMLVKPEIL